MTKTYTQDWFDRAIPDLTVLLKDLKGKDDLRFLEIGSYEGRSTCWLMDNILTSPSSTVHCIDLWEDSGKMGAWAKELYDRYDMANVFGNFLRNTKEYGSKVTYEIGVSQILLRKLPLDNQFDFIYVDGSHIASDVLEDGILAFRLLKQGGIMVFDDYNWDFFGDQRRHPKIAIDAFFAIYEGKYDLLYKGRQAFIRKSKQDMHIV